MDKSKELQERLRAAQHLLDSVEDQEERADQQLYLDQVHHKGSSIITQITDGVLLVQYATPVGEGEMYYAARLLNKLGQAKAKVIDAFKSAYVGCLDLIDDLKDQLMREQQRGNLAEERLKQLRDMQIASGGAYADTVRERLGALPVLMVGEGPEAVAWVNLTAATLAMLDVPTPPMPPTWVAMEEMIDTLRAMSAETNRPSSERRFVSKVAETLDLALQARTPRAEPRSTKPLEQFYEVWEPEKK